MLLSSLLSSRLQARLPSGTREIRLSRSQKLLPLAIAAAALGACAKPAMLQAPSAAVAIAPVAASADAVPASTIEKSNFDSATPACSNFFTHANGGWLSKNPVPSDQSSWGSFNILQDRLNLNLRKILDDAAANPASAGLEKMVGDYYSSAMDEEKIDALGAKPLAGDLARISSVKNKADIVRYIIEEQVKGGVVFGFGESGDYQDPTRVIGFAGQGGLGLPDRDYYLNTDADSQKLLAQYHAHITMMFVLSGQNALDAQAAATGVIAFETRLAKASLTRLERRDPLKQYRLVSVAQANAETPNFNWGTMFQAMNLKIEKFSLTSPAFFAEFNSMLGDTNAAVWRDYFRWGTLRGGATFLSQPFADESFNFYGKTLRGTKEQRVRWKRMVENTSGYLDEPLGQLYVAKYFPPEAKAQAMELITDLKAALKVRLENLDWMSAQTKQQALEKFATFTPKIGFPDKWRDYSSVEIRRDDFYGNAERLAQFGRAFSLSKIGKATDRSEWGMSPQTVNAYYNPQMNEIVFPAAILQPPFFDPKADRALNYGGIGGVIGHELLHGFDDQGSQFDAKGAQRNWWTDADRKKFEARTAKLDAQASGTKIGGMAINGKLTMGENIADLGGTTIAYDALQLALKRQPEAAIDGYSPEQRFYLSWAQIWRRNMVPESLTLQIKTDPHSPSLFRVNGPLANQENFAKAFNCRPSDGMVSPDATRVVIW
jgi:putative endopeptidase